MIPISRPRSIMLVIILFAFGLILALVGCAGPAPVDAPSPTPAGPLLTATPALTAEQQMALDELKKRHACDPDCLATRQAQASYAEYGTPHQISRPEWQTLFPKALFYLVPWVDHYQGFQYAHNALFVTFEGRWYEVKTYDLLLAANGIVVTDDNRETIARAWALMTLEDFLDADVVFTDWKSVEMPQAEYPYNYSLEAWTKIGGIQVRWFFVFEGSQLKVAAGPGTLNYRTGDFIESEQSAPAFHDYPFYARSLYLK